MYEKITRKKTRGIRLTSLFTFARWDPAYQNIVVLRRYKLVFCPIPKIACSNWKITLRHAEGYTDNDETIAHDRINNGLTYLHTQNFFWRATWLTRPDVCRAVFVRNPWTRVLSAYRSKLEGRRPNEVANDLKTHYQFEVLTNVRKDGGPISFDEFITFLENCPPDRMNEHWQPQSQIASLDRVSYNFIGRFEQLDDDIEILIRRCKLPPFYRGKIKSVPATQSSERNVLTRYYTSDLIERVGNIYASDIRLLGYVPPL